MATGLRCLDRTPEDEPGFSGRVRRNFDRLRSASFVITPYRRVTADTMATDDDDNGTIDCDTTSGAITVGLLTASGIAGRTIVVKNTGAAGNDVTIRAKPGELIDGSATLVLTDGQVARIQATDAKSWIRL